MVSSHILLPQRMCKLPFRLRFDSQPVSQIQINKNMWEMFITVINDSLVAYKQTGLPRLLAIAKMMWGIQRSLTIPRILTQRCVDKNTNEKANKNQINRLIQNNMTNVKVTYISIKWFTPHSNICDLKASFMSLCTCQISDYG